MSLTSSPQQDIHELLGRRRLAVIPRDQQELLDNDDAWVVDRPKDRRGQAHIPEEVLKTVKQTFLAKKSQRREDEDAASSSDDAESRQALTQVDHSGQRDASCEVHVAPGHEPSLSSPPPPSQRTVSSWAESPERSPRRKQAPIQSSVVQETPKAVPEMPGRESQHIDPRMISVVEEDDEEEDEMEMALPLAHQFGDAPVNREAARLTIASTPAATIPSQAVDTPPCGQPNQHVIPDSVPMKKTSPQSGIEAGERRWRRMKPITFEGTTPMKPINPSTSFNRMPTTKQLPIPIVNSSMSTSSSSLIPATCASISTQDSTRADPVGELSANDPERPQLPFGANISHAPATVDLTHNATENSEEDERLDDDQRGNTTPVKHQDATDPPATPNPYDEFVTQYPEYIPTYGGTVRNFVKACLCLEYLENERSLRDYLYDDFIRSFSGGYLKYVGGAGAGREPLPAIEWFNMLSGAPLFTKMVITKQTLVGALESYPDEVARSRKFIAGDVKEDKQVNTADNSAMSHEQHHNLNGAMDIDTPTPEKQPPGPARTQRPVILSQPADQRSPRLGSEGRVEPLTVTPTSSAVSRAPRGSQYFDRLASSSKSGVPRKRSAEEQARLREHFRRRKASGMMSSAGSRPGSS